MPDTVPDTRLRRYAQWSGNPRGIPENISRCVEAVYKDYRHYQCDRKRGHGPDALYCKQHAKRFDQKG